MNKTVLGIFADREDAEGAIQELQTSGYDAKDISIMMKDKDEAKVIASDTGTDVATGAASGATTGGVIGGIAGLLAGIGALTIPGIGPFLIAGPVASALGLTGAAATTVSGAVTGALAGGLIGALMSLGLSEDEARVYETGLNEGGILVAIPAHSGDSRDAERILRDYHADQVKSISHDTTDRSSTMDVSRQTHHTHDHDMADKHSSGHGYYVAGSEYSRKDVTPMDEEE